MTDSAAHGTNSCVAVGGAADAFRLEKSRGEFPVDRSRSAATPGSGRVTLAVIGGTGLEALGGRPEAVRDSAETPYGPASAIPRRFGTFPDTVFLNRHGDGHVLLPHEINYRANIWLLKELGVRAIVAVFAVGGIEPSLKDGTLVLPTQIVDYTWGREHTFSTRESLYHADFSEPFDAGLRARLVDAAQRADVALVVHGVYGATQGPRFETIAEIDRMARDGCTVVGMTAMPEAGLARELEIPYAGLCMIVNPAGRGPAVLTVDDMYAAVAEAQPRLLRLLTEFLKRD